MPDFAENQATAVEQHILGWLTNFPASTRLILGGRTCPTNGPGNWPPSAIVCARLVDPLNPPSWFSPASAGRIGMQAHASRAETPTKPGMRPDDAACRKWGTPMPQEGNNCGIRPSQAARKRCRTRQRRDRSRDARVRAQLRMRLGQTGYMLCKTTPMPTEDSPNKHGATRTHPDEMHAAAKQTHKASRWSGNTPSGNENARPDICHLGLLRGRPF